MFNETLQKIEREIQGGALEPARKEELLRLLTALRAELETLSLTQGDQAQRISGFVALSAHEATREKTQDPLLQLSLRGLVASGQELEASHPRLVGLVNQLCTVLTSLGV